MSLLTLLPERIKLVAVNWPTILSVYKIPLILLSISLFSFIFAIFIIRSLITPLQPIQITTNQQFDALSSIDIKLIVVDVKGAVKNPGVYKLPIGSRVDDALTSAGGLTVDADISTIEKTINSAQIVSDGQKIYFPRESEVLVNEPNKAIKSSTNTSNNTLISINFSSRSELEGLSGVGPVTAEKIISGRPYSSLEELVDKKIIGEKLFEKIKDQLSL